MTAVGVGVLQAKWFNPSGRKMSTSESAEGLKAMQEMRYDDAIVIFDRLLRQDPSNHSVLRYRRMALYDMGELEEAIEDLRWVRCSGGVGAMTVD